MVIGSPGYTAPERARGEHTGPESDLWSLGATLYFAVEGRPAYERSSVSETLAALMSEQVDPPTQAGPLRPVLEQLLNRDYKTRLTAAQANAILRAVADTPPRIWRIRRRRRPVPPAAPASQAPRVAAPSDEGYDSDRTMLIIRPQGGLRIPGSGPAPVAEPPAPMPPASPAAASATPPPSGSPETGWVERPVVPGWEGRSRDDRAHPALRDPAHPLRDGRDRPALPDPAPPPPGRQGRPGPPGHPARPSPGGRGRPAPTPSGLRRVRPSGRRACAARILPGRETGSDGHAAPRIPDRAWTGSPRPGTAGTRGTPSTWQPDAFNGNFPPPPGLGTDLFAIAGQGTLFWYPARKSGRPRRRGSGPADPPPCKAEGAPGEPFPGTVEVSGPGFLNITLDDDWIAPRRRRPGRPAPRRRLVTPPQTVVIDYSAPNAAKEMHVGHLRTHDRRRRAGPHARAPRQHGHPAEPPRRLGHAVRHAHRASARHRRGDRGRAARGRRGQRLLPGGREPSSTADPEFKERARAAGVPAPVRRCRRPCGSGTISWTPSKRYFNKVYAQLGVTLTDDDIAGESMYNSMLAGGLRRPGGAGSPSSARARSASSRPASPAARASPSR